MKLSFVDSADALIQDVLYAGGPVITKNLAQRLPRYFDVDYYPRLLTILGVKNKKQRESLL
ncbi:MAG: hypothetical protein ACP5L2_07910, partial [Conexivisphaera sp.]